MNKRLLLVVVGLLSLTGFEMTGTAKPCRAGFPNCRRPPPPPPAPPIATMIYQRVDPAPPPSNLDRATLARLLAGSPWTRLGSREQIRFVDPPSTGHFARPPDRSIRAVTIDLIRDRRTLLVNIDGDLYTVATCEMLLRTATRGVVATTCLEHREAGGAFGGQGYGGATYGGR